MTRARVGGVVDLSTVDWYGKVTSMIFFSGCNFRCPYCQNASLISVDSGKDLEIADLQKRIEGNLDIVDAVGFSGGEPCLQTEALKALARMAKTMGLKVLLETNGSNPAAIDALADEELLDYVAIDVKAPLRPERYGMVAGVGYLGVEVTQRVRAALEECLKKKLVTEARTTIVPTLIDQETEIREIANETTGVDLYTLQQFSPEGDLLDQSFKSLRPPSRQDLLRLARAASECGHKEIRIRTREYGEERVWP